MKRKDDKGCLNTCFGVILFLLTILIISGCNWYQDDLIRYEEYLCTIDTTGQNFQYLIKAEDFSQYVVPPDNSKILIFKTYAIYSANLDGSNYQLYSQCPDSIKFGINLSWTETPEGFRIIWEWYSDIYVYDYNNDEFTQVTNTPDIREEYCRFSYDGSHIIYCEWIKRDSLNANPHIDSSIHTMKYDYTDKQCIIEETDYTISFYHPVMDSEKIVYRVHDDTGSFSGIYSVNIDGTDNTQVYHGVSDLSTPLLLIEEETSVIFENGPSLYLLNFENSVINELARGSKLRISESQLRLAYYYIGLKIMNNNGTNQKYLKEGGGIGAQPPVFYQNDTKILFESEREL